MKTPPDRASAPPMDKGYWRQLGKRDGLRWTITWLHNRAKSMNDRKATAILQGAAFSLGNEIREGRMPSIPEDRDGWNAALAAQPPAPFPEYGLPKPRRKDGGEPCGECHLQPGETCDICGAYQPSTPPQPGDAERLERIRRRLRYRQFMEQFSYEDVATLQRTLDAAQSALAAQKCGCDFCEWRRALAAQPPAPPEAPGNYEAQRMVDGGTPPQPGDAERLAKVRRQHERHDVDCDVCWLLCLLDERIAEARTLRNSAVTLSEQVDAAQEARKSSVREGAENRRALDEAVIEAARKVLAQYEPHEIVDAEAELRDALAARDAALVGKGK